MSEPNPISSLMPPIADSIITPKTPPEPDYDGSLWQCIYDHAAVHGEDSLYQVDVIPPHYILRVATSDRAWVRLSVMEMSHEELEDLVEEERLEFYGRSRLGWEVRLADDEIDLGDPARERPPVPYRTRQDPPARDAPKKTRPSRKRVDDAVVATQHVPETAASRARAKEKAAAAAAAEERQRAAVRAADVVEMPTDEDEVPDAPDRPATRRVSAPAKTPTPKRRAPSAPGVTAPPSAKKKSPAAKKPSKTTGKKPAKE